MKLYKLSCSRCKWTCRRKTRGEALSAMRKHQWKYHRAWLLGRMKTADKDSANNPHVLRLLQDLVTGNFIPGYRVYKRKHYEILKPVLDKLSPFMPPAIQVAWKGIDKLADIMYGKK